MSGGKVKKDRSTELINLALALLFFLNIFYWFRGFHFGVNNNQEELPLLYALTGLAKYPVDSFVQFHIQNYTQISPFLFLMKWLIKMLQIENFQSLFLSLHILTISGLFITIHLFLKRTLNPNPLIATAFATFILFHSRTFIPADRWFFTSIFDIELFVILLVCLIIYFHIEKKFKITSVLLSVAGILYPIYTIPIYPVLLVSLYLDFYKHDKKRLLTIFAGYTVLPAAYIIFLWSISRQTISTDIDSSAIMEYIRAPWHYKIPSITYMDKKSVGFLLLCIPTFLLCHKFLKESYWNNNLKFFFYGMLTILLLTSIIHSIVRIPLIVQISPYRIGVFAVFIAFLILIVLLIQSFKMESLLRFKIKGSIALGLLVILAVSLTLGLKKTFDRKEFSTEQLDAMQWIRENTPEDALFLDYAGLDIRTNCFRSSYWEFKTIPLTANQQVLWYKKYLLYNAKQEVIPPNLLAEDFVMDRSVEISTFGVAGKNKFEAVRLLKDSIDYVVVNATDTFTTSLRKPIFENGELAVIKVTE